MKGVVLWCLWNRFQLCRIDHIMWVDCSNKIRKENRICCLSAFIGYKGRHHQHRKTLHMPRKGSSCRTMPRSKGCLNNALRAASDLCSSRVEGSLATATGVPSESRVRVDSSAVQDSWCRVPTSVHYVLLSHARGVT